MTEESIPHTSSEIENKQNIFSQIFRNSFKYSLLLSWKNKNNIYLEMISKLCLNLCMLEKFDSRTYTEKKLIKSFCSCIITFETYFLKFQQTYLNFFFYFLRTIKEYIYWLQKLKRFLTKNSRQTAIVLNKRKGNLIKY